MEEENPSNESSHKKVNRLTSVSDFFMCLGAKRVGLISLDLRKIILNTINQHLTISSTMSCGTVTITSTWNRHSAPYGTYLI